MQQPEISMPHSVDLEESLLSSLFDDPEGVQEASAILKPDHFYTGRHRKIYQAFLQLVRDGEAPDGILLMEELKRQGRLDEVGGAVGLVKLKHEVPPAGSIKGYSEKIRDLALKRTMIENALAIVKRASNGESADSVLKFAHEQLQALTRPSVSYDTRQVVHISNVYTAERMVAEYEGYLKNLKDNRFNTGIHQIDKHIRGIGGGEVLTILARAGSFKTAMLQNLLLRYVKNSNLCAVFFSIEMPVASVAERYFEILDGCTGFEVERMFIDPTQAVIAAASIKQFKADLERLLIVDTKISLESIPQYIELIHREMGKRVGLVGIDYLGLMDAPGKDEYQQVSAIAKGMKNMAKAINLPVILLSQVSRKGGDGEVEVTLDMGRGSGTIEEAADIVLGLWQQEVPGCGVVGGDQEYELICRLLKNRKGAKGRRWRLELDPKTLRFGENAADYQPPKIKRRKRATICEG